MPHKKFKEFQEKHDEAMQDIKRFLEPTKHEPQMHELVLWMMQTEHNPYGFMDDGYASYLSGSAINFAGLLHIMSHALYDDGDIAFVTVNNEPKIIFWDKWDENLKDHALSDIQKRLEAEGSEYEVKVLDIKPNEFGDLYDKYAKEQELKFAWVNELTALHDRTLSF